MAIITEESDSLKRKPKTKPSTPNPSTFWFYFTISASLLTFIFVTISSLYTTQDPRTWFLMLPTYLRHHYSNGRTIKVQTALNAPLIEVFTIQDGPFDSSDNVLIVHGLGCSSYSFSKVVKYLGKKGVHVVALDLPGSGFSEKSEKVVEEKVIGGFGRILELYREIKEKGLFWGFDQLVENGYVNYDYAENEIRVSKVETEKVIELGPDEVGRVLRQVIESMGLAPVDLVLHDSAFGLGANWVSKNSGLIRSVTLLDSTSNQPAFPLWVLRIPVVREVVLGFDFLFCKAVETCCSKSCSGFDVESHRLLLKNREGRRSVVGMGKKLNSSFDIVEWGNLVGVRGLPMQVIWSSASSEEWSKEGRKVASVLPQATFVTHSSGRWPQDDTADEVGESIYEFVSKLPKPVKPVKEKEHIPERVRRPVDEAKPSGHGHGDHDHDHFHEIGYPNAYGLGHEFT